jgi:hypothetical protein
MLVCVFLHNFAHETAGAARIRLSLRPLFGEAGIFFADLGRIAPRERGRMHGDLPSLRALLRVVGRGRGWGVYRRGSLPVSVRIHPPPPTPPRRFAGGGEKNGWLFEN